MQAYSDDLRERVAAAYATGQFTIHKAAGLAELVEARGARLLYVPPYSPDFTPLELAFSKLKTHLRSAAARTREALKTALDAALAWITLKLLTVASCYRPNCTKQAA